MMGKLDRLKQSANRPAGSAGEEQARAKAIEPEQKKEDPVDNQEPETPKRGVGRPREHDAPMRTVSVKITQDTYEALQRLLAMLLVTHGEKTNLSKYIANLIDEDLARHARELEAFLGGK